MLNKKDDIAIVDAILDDTARQPQAQRLDQVANRVCQHQTDVMNKKFRDNPDYEVPY